MQAVTKEDITTVLFAGDHEPSSSSTRADESTSTLSEDPRFEPILILGVEHDGLKRTPKAVDSFGDELKWGPDLLNKVSALLTDVFLANDPNRQNACKIINVVERDFSRRGYSKTQVLSFYISLK